MVTAAYFALIPSDNVKLETIGRYSDIGWFDVRKLPRLSYDHKKISEYALKRFQWKLEYTNVVYSLLPRYFTLTDLKKIYEIIFGKKLDRRNFQRKIKPLGLVKPTMKSRGGKHRPAELYEFKFRKPRILGVL